MNNSTNNLKSESDSLRQANRTKVWKKFTLIMFGIILIGCIFSFLLHWLSTYKLKDFNARDFTWFNHSDNLAYYSSGKIKIINFKMPLFNKKIYSTSCKDTDSYGRVFLSVNSSDHYLVTAGCEESLWLIDLTSKSSKKLVSNVVGKVDWLTEDTFIYYKNNTIHKFNILNGQDSEFLLNTLGFEVSPDKKFIAFDSFETGNNLKSFLKIQDLTSQVTKKVDLATDEYPVSTLNSTDGTRNWFKWNSLGSELYFDQNKKTMFYNTETEKITDTKTKLNIVGTYKGKMISKDEFNQGVYYMYDPVTNASIKEDSGWQSIANTESIKFSSSGEMTAIYGQYQTSSFPSALFVTINKLN